MKVAIDIGNTLTKMGFFEGRELLKTSVIQNYNMESFIQELNKDKAMIDEVIVSSVIDLADDVINYLNSNFRWLPFTSTTPIPIVNMYQTPLTIGMDRLAAVIGARVFHKTGNILTIDAGTCITYDFINSNDEYLGGGISPGLMMRYKALNNYTSKLPLVQIMNDMQLIGRDTIGSIKSGVLNGAIAEVKGIIDQYSSYYPNLQVIITGGDNSFFAINLRNSIFAAPHLVLHGLNEVLIYNKTDILHND